MAKEKQQNTVDVMELYPEGYSFNLSDFALFLSVMKEKRAYQNVLSIILDEPDISITEVKVEQVVINKPKEIEIGLIDRTPRGRIATEKAYKHLKIAYQSKLF